MRPIEPPPSRHRARFLSAALRGLPFGHQTAMRMVARSLGNADHFWACFDGFLWRVDVSDFFMSGGIVWRGIHEPVVTLMLRALLNPGDVFLDAGANKGYFSLLASRQLGPSGRVWAVEAFPPNAAILRENLNANHTANVTVVDAALSNHIGEIGFRAPSQGTTGDGGVSADATLRVPATTLDALTQAHSIHGIAVMKMDIEGAELAALRGAAHLLTEQRIHHIILELHTAVLSRDDAQTTMRLIADAGYSCRRLLTERDAQLGRRALGAAPDADRWSIPYDPHAPWTADWAPTFWWTTH